MRTVARLAAIVSTGVLAIVAFAWWTGFELESWRNFGQPRNVVEVAGENLRIPLPEGDGARLAAEVPVTTAGSYAFIFEESADGPTRYDPCAPLRWVLNAEGMPDGAETLVHDAVAEVSRASGLVFEYQGGTDEPAVFGRELVQERYGDGLVPLIIGWSDEEATPDLEGSITGLGGSSSITGAFGSQRYLAAGVVILDREDFEGLLETTRGTGVATAVIMHEIAHVIGLAHVDDPTELMHDENSMLITWGPGDRAGLAIAGAGPCQ